MAGAKFNCHDSGSHFKKSTLENQYIFVTELKLRKIEHAITRQDYTSNFYWYENLTFSGMKISTCVKNNWGG